MSYWVISSAGQAVNFNSETEARNYVEKQRYDWMAQTGGIPYTYSIWYGNQLVEEWERKHI